MLAKERSVIKQEFVVEFVRSQFKDTAQEKEFVEAVEAFNGQQVR